MKNNRYDAIVVGAGPAGSTAAYLLGLNGLTVLLLDKNRFPRSKLCGGLLTRKTIHLLEQIFQTPPNFLQSQKIIAFQSLRYQVATSHGEFLHKQLDYPFHFVERKSYDFFWLKRASTAGVVVKPGEKVVHLDAAKSQVITNHGHRFSGRFIIGADGVFSKIRTTLFNQAEARRRWNSGLAIAFATAIPNGEVPYLPKEPLICFGIIPWGYGWCFPGEDVRIVGLCGLKTKAGKLLRRGLDQLMQSLQISEIQLPPLRSHPIPFGNYLIHPGQRNILLAGDAGGFADPLLGEGIYYAHKSAQMAADAVLASFGNPSSACLKYSLLLRQSIITELQFAKLGRNIIFSLPGNWPARLIVALLRRSPQKCEQTIQGMRSFKWFRPLAKEALRPDRRL
jgi:geranylgeranyl reductase family protein